MFINGDKVRVRITDIKHWNETVRNMVNGKEGIIEKTSCKYAGKSKNGMRNSDKVKFMVVFPEPIPPPETDKYRSVITGFWFDANELEMVWATSGDRCEHDWRERSNHGEFNQIVCVERTCSKCKRSQIANLDGGTGEPEWEDVKAIK